MKIDFRNIQVKDIDGKSSTVDIAKILGNAIYKQTADLGELELAQNIYKNGEVELSTEQAEHVKEYVKSNFIAVVQLAVNEALAGKVEYDIKSE